MQDISYFIRRAAREFGANVAVDDGARARTFGELVARSERFANALEALVPHGGAVGILSENRAEYVEVDLGLLFADRVRVALNARLQLEDFRHVAGDCDMRAIVFSAQFADVAAALADELGLATIALDGAGGAHDYGELIAAAPAPARTRSYTAGDTAVITYTSGTTGVPKGVELSRRSIQQVTWQLILDLERPRAGDMIVLPQPLSHGAGYFVLPYLVCGAGLYVMDKYDAELALELSTRPNVNTLKAVPAMLPPLLEAQRARRHGYSTIIYGAAPIGAALLERALDELGPVLMQIYGQSEAPMAISCLQKEDHLVEDDRRVSAGRPWRTVAVEIRSDDGEPRTAGATGEVVVRAPQVMTGYLGQPETTAAVLRDGWLHTRDMGMLDEHGFLHLLGRTDEMINSGGFNIAPREVERALDLHPAVADSVVVGVPDDRWGERVTAVVQCHPDAELTEQELIASTKERLGFRNPKQVVLLDGIPKNAYGKVDRAALRALLVEHAGLEQADPAIPTQGA